MTELPLLRTERPGSSALPAMGIMAKEQLMTLIDALTVRPAIMSQRR
jgi:hypothetical protein